MCISSPNIGCVTTMTCFSNSKFSDSFISNNLWKHIMLNMSPAVFWEWWTIKPSEEGWLGLLSGLGSLHPVYVSLSAPLCPQGKGDWHPYCLRWWCMCPSLAYSSGWWLKWFTATGRFQQSERKHWERVREYHSTHAHTQSVLLSSPNVLFSHQ